MQITVQINTSNIELVPTWCENNILWQAETGLEGFHVVQKCNKSNGRTWPARVIKRYLIDLLCVSESTSNERWPSRQTPTAQRRRRRRKREEKTFPRRKRLHFWTEQRPLWWMSICNPPTPHPPNPTHKYSQRICSWLVWLRPNRRNRSAGRACWAPRRLPASRFSPPRSGPPPACPICRCSGTMKGTGLEEEEDRVRKGTVHTVPLKAAPPALLAGWLVRLSGNLPRVHEQK